MTANPVVCPECGSPVPYGRLSCTSCGALLAAVSGAERRSRPAAIASAEAEEFDEDRPVGGLGPEPEPVLAAEPEPEPPMEATPVPAPAAGPDPGPSSAAAPKPTPAPKPAPARKPTPARKSRTAPEPEPAPVEPSGPRPAPVILREWTGPLPEELTAAEAQPAALAVGSPSRTAIEPPPTSVQPAPSSPVLGAYLAPSTTYVAPAAASSAPASGSPTPGSPATLPPAPGVSPARSLLGDLAASLPSEVATWLVVVGSVVAIFSFLMPWATNSLIGTQPGVGYFAEWGLANPGHLLLVLVAAAVLVLNVMANRIPAWFRTGVLPLVVGGLLLGVAFVYYARPFGGGTGVTLLLFGAVALLVGGLLGVQAGRNESAPPGV